MDGKVYAVENVCFIARENEPRRLTVHASGEANSTGWTEGRLIPWTYVDRPADGLVDFDFVAKAPEEFVWEISSISGVGGLDLQDWIKGVRIHSATNHLEALLSEKKRMVEVQPLAAAGPEVPFPLCRV